MFPKGAYRTVRPFVITTCRSYDYNIGKIEGKQARFPREGQVLPKGSLPHILYIILRLTGERDENLLFTSPLHPNTTKMRNFAAAINHKHIDQDGKDYKRNGTALPRRRTAW